MVKLIFLSDFLSLEMLYKVIPSPMRIANTHPVVLRQEEDYVILKIDVEGEEYPIIDAILRHPEVIKRIDYFYGEWHQFARGKYQEYVSRSRVTNPNPSSQRTFSKNFHQDMGNRLQFRVRYVLSCRLIHVRSAAERERVKKLVNEMMPKMSYWAGDEQRAQDMYSRMTSSFPVWTYRISSGLRTSLKATAPLRTFRHML